MNNMFSLLLYFSVFLLSVLLYGLSKKKSFNSNLRKVLFFASIFIIVVFAAMRNNVGTDYKNYLNMVTSEKYSSLTTFFADKDTEIGFFLINYIGRFFNSIQVTMAIASFITIIFYHLAMKKFEKENVIAYLIFLFTIFPFSFNIVRQAMAMSIVFYAIAFLYKKDYKKFILLIFLAATIHLTALFSLVLILFDARLYFKENDKTYKKYIIPGVLLSLTLIFMINFTFFIGLITKLPYLEHYSYLTNSVNVGGNKDIYLTAVLLILIVIFSFRSYKKDINLQVLLIFIIFAVILLLGGFFNPDAKRIATYFDLVYIVFIIEIINNRKSIKWKNIFSVGFILYALTRFVLVFYYLGNAEIFPYAIKWFI